MAYVLPGSRVLLDLDGPSVEVDQVLSETIHLLGIVRLGKLLGSRTPEAKIAAKTELYELVAQEARPTWDIIDHRGPVPPTSTGMLRLPDEIGLVIVTGWLDTLPVPEEAKGTAVDAVVPPGKVRNELNRRLRLVKAA